MEHIKNFINHFFSFDTSFLPNYLLSPQRFITLGVVVVLTLALFLIFKNKTEKSRRGVFTFLSVLMLVLIVGEKAFLAADGYTELIYILLPLNFSELVFWMIILSSTIRKQGFFNSTVLTALIIGVTYAAFPVLGMNKTPITFLPFVKIATNSIALIFGLLGILLRCANFKKGRKLEAYITLLVFALYAVLINYVIFPAHGFFYLSVPFVNNSELLFPVSLIFAAFVILFFEIVYRVSARKKKAKEN